MRRTLKERRRRRRIPSRPVLLNILRLAWILIVGWGEVGLYHWSKWFCGWPSIDALPSTHVLLVTDAQVQPPTESSSWLDALRQFVFELNLRRNWKVATSFVPDYVIFLGDQLAQGKYIQSRSEFQTYVNKFNSVFQTLPGIPRAFIPGNNDVGMGVSSASVARSFYSDFFGPPNRILDIQNHTFICLDAPALVDEDYQRSAHGIPFSQWSPVAGGTVEFIQAVQAEQSTSNPRILLSHIPLGRPDTASCGPSREGNHPLRRGVGHGYQNTLGKQTTSFLLESLQPDMVFSGDDRNYCEYNHLHVVDRQLPTIVPEVTVKSLSAANHIHNPGFQLLSLFNPQLSPFQSRQRTIAHSPCLLPDQYGMYTNVYRPLAILSFLALFVFNLYRHHHLKSSYLPFIAIGTKLRTPNPSQPPSPRSSPLESNIWSPYAAHAPVSPRNVFPSTIRVPNFGSGPSQMTASRPGTPLASPFLSPMIYQDDEDDTMFPTQYAARPAYMEKDWSPEHKSSHEDDSGSYFLPVPKVRGRSWTWSFVLYGRRRRITLHAPQLSRETLSDFIALLEGPGADASVHRRGLIKSVLIDVVSVAWVGTLFWTILAWWTF